MAFFYGISFKSSPHFVRTRAQGSKLSLILSPFVEMAEKHESLPIYLKYFLIGLGNGKHLEIVWAQFSLGLVVKN